MTVVTPSLYQAFAERGLGPRLKPPVAPLPFPWRLSAARSLAGRNLTAMLRPETIDHLAKEGGTGVPLFGENELHAFVSEAEPVSPDRQPHGQWWEFWPTSDGRFAMFPGDDASQRSISTTEWVPTGMSAHVRRSEMRGLFAYVKAESILVTAGGAGSRDRDTARPRPSVLPEPCELRADLDEPGAPYIGRCEDHGCDRGCRPHVVVVPNDGIHRLLGCDCSLNS